MTDILQSGPQQLPFLSILLLKQDTLYFEHCDCCILIITKHDYNELRKKKFESCRRDILQAVILERGFPMLERVQPLSILKDITVKSA